MSDTFTPGPSPSTVRAADGKVLTVPDGWVLFPPGDAALTRRVKAAGDHWVVQEKKGRKVFSRGVWAPAATIERIRAELEVERTSKTTPLKAGLTENLLKQVPVANHHVERCFYNGKLCVPVNLGKVKYPHRRRP